MNHSFIAETIIDELLERDWNLSQLVIAGGAKENPEFGLRFLAIQMFLNVDDENIKLGSDGIDWLAKAFDVSREFLENLEKSGRRFCGNV